MWYTLLVTLAMSSETITEHALVGVCHTKRMDTMKTIASAIPFACSSWMIGKRRNNLTKIWYRKELVCVGIPLLGICRCVGIGFLAARGTKGSHWPPRLQNTNSSRIFFHPLLHYRRRFFGFINGGLPHPLFRGEYGAIWRSYLSLRYKRCYNPQC